MGGSKARAKITPTISSVGDIDNIPQAGNLLRICRQLAFAGQFLRPVADAIAFQMQAAVAICIIGPVADRNGEVEVRRYIVRNNLPA